MLKRSEKETLVTDLAGTLRQAPAVAVASFRALTMRESAKLRRGIRPAGGQVRVVPKRLFRRVLEELKWPAALAATDESVAVAWAPDPLAPAKGLWAFVSAAKDARLLGGILDGRVLDVGAVSALATLPPLEVLRGQVVGLIAAPARGFVGVLGSVLRAVPAVLQAKAKRV